MRDLSLKTSATLLKTLAYFNALPDLPKGNEEMEKPEILVQGANYIGEKMWTFHVQSHDLSESS